MSKRKAEDEIQPNWTVCDLMDDNPNVQFANPAIRFRSFGGKNRYCGQIYNILAPKDNSFVKAAAAKDGTDKILCVDGGGDVTWSLVGDQIAAKALGSGYNGFLVYGAVRDVDEIAKLNIGCLALAACPRKTIKKERGADDVATLTFAGLELKRNEWIYIDNDGIIVSETKIH